MDKPAIRTLFRDVCAALRRCSDSASPATVTAKSPDELRFDEPPLRMRPHHEKRALSYLVHVRLNEQGVFVHPAELPVDYFVDHADEPLDTAVDIVLNQQEPVA